MYAVIKRMISELAQPPDLHDEVNTHGALFNNARSVRRPGHVTCNSFPVRNSNQEYEWSDLLTRFLKITSRIHICYLLDAPFLFSVLGLER